VLLRQRDELVQLLQLHHEWFFAQDVFARRKGALGVVEVRDVRGADVDGVDLLRARGQ
jgi:hypothetical protein